MAGVAEADPAVQPAERSEAKARAEVRERAWRSAVLRSASALGDPGNAQVGGPSEGRIVPGAGSNVPSSTPARRTVPGAGVSLVNKFCISI